MCNLANSKSLLKVYMLQISEVIKYLETLAPIALQESYDNCGLLVGDAQAPLKGILISLDVTEAIIQEAISEGCNLVIAHHPIIFKGIKKINNTSFIDRTIVAAIKNDIAIYAIHTNLDNVWQGVNHKIAEKLGLVNCKPLQTISQSLSKFNFYCPSSHTAEVLAAVHAVGAGVVGNYTHCAFTTSGSGQFMPNAFAKPFQGSANKLEQTPEDKVELIFPNYLKSKVVAAFLASHPYEEPAYDITLLENHHPQIGAGRVGMLPEPMSPSLFLQYLKDKLSVSLIRHTTLVNNSIQKVALCGGSGSFLFTAAKNAKADIYISSDFKYHEFFEADEHTMIADINHYEAEYFTKELIFEFLNLKFANIALVLSKVNTNPISYF